MIDFKKIATKQDFKLAGYSDNFEYGIMDFQLKENIPFNFLASSNNPVSFEIYQLNIDGTSKIVETISIDNIKIVGSNYISDWRINSLESLKCGKFLYFKIFDGTNYFHSEIFNIVDTDYTNIDMFDFDSSFDNSFF